MRCNDFDTHIDEMLSGILHPDASQHMQQCERCTSHFRARATVQNALRKMASANGPSRATDRAVMDSYRRLQQRRAATGAHAPAASVALDPASATGAASVAAYPAPAARGARMISFPDRNFAPLFASRAWTSRTWLSGAAAAAVVFAVLGSAVHLWNGVPTVSAPSIATAPAAPVQQQTASVAAPAPSVSVGSALRHGMARLARHAVSPRSAATELASVAPSPADRVVTASTTRPRAALAYGESSNYDSGPQLPSNAAPVIRLASTGAASSNVAQSASSTWPGYSNLMYCDPVVCSGPMQVVHIKVPVGQVKPNVGQSVGNAFVNAEVVVGPDGVARAIRVAN